MKRLIFGLMLGLLPLLLSADIPGRFFVQAGVSGNGFLGSHLGSKGFNGTDFYVPESVDLLLPLLDPSLGGGWFADGGILLDTMPIFIELGGGQSFHGGTWKNREGLVSGDPGEIVSSTMLISSLGLRLGWEFEPYRAIIPRVFAGAGFTGSYSDKGGKFPSGGSYGGFSGFFLSFGGGGRYALNREISLFARLAYELDIFSVALWKEGTAALDPWIFEHQILLKIGGTYWLPY